MLTLFLTPQIQPARHENGNAHGRVFKTFKGRCFTNWTKTRLKKRRKKKKKTVVSLFLYSIPVDRASDGSSFGESPWMYYGSDKSGPFNVYEIARVFLRTAAGIIYEFQLLKSSQSYTLPLHRRRGRRSQELHHTPGGHYIGCLGGSGNRAPDSWSEGRAFDTLRERRENFLFHT